MSFQNSARNIRLEDGHILKAELADEQGDWHDAEIDLDEILGNDRGVLEWSGGGFSRSSKDITVEHLFGDSGPPILKAQLGDGQGGHRYVEANLGDRLVNENGKFVFRP
ncbi:Cyanovirin-N [Ascosphaera apis ARSEF 7405]|uniref:Cyanovirin-N n=1 Tax=Ascosphaera apis ARSEF 7405 TaxID=392613 RepID=A0A162I1K2_9EURO|nr:Cyanovirin-N [Ascosphaera apis ARSEF 7405]